MASINDPNGKGYDGQVADPCGQAADPRYQADAAQSAAALAGGVSRKHEMLIAALLAEPTLARAARRAGVSQRTLYRQLARPEFRAAYKRARQELVAAAVARLQSMAAEAVEALASIVRTGRKDSDRIRAAVALLDYALRDADKTASDDAGDHTVLQRLLATAEGRDLAIRMSDLLAGRPGKPPAGLPGTQRNGEQRPDGPW
jgi:hypothetical protein